MPIARRPGKQAKTDPVMTAGEGLIPGSDDATSGNDKRLTAASRGTGSCTSCISATARWR